MVDDFLEMITVTLPLLEAEREKGETTMKPEGGKGIRLTVTERHFGYVGQDYGMLHLAICQSCMSIAAIPDEIRCTPDLGGVIREILDKDIKCCPHPRYTFTKVNIVGRKGG